MPAAVARALHVWRRVIRFCGHPHWAPDSTPELFAVVARWEGWELLAEAMPTSWRGVLLRGARARSRHGPRWRRPAPVRALLLQLAFLVLIIRIA